MASRSGAHTVHADLVRGTIAEVKQLTVDRLKRVLKYEGLQVSGLKSELQTRLIAHVYDCDRKGEYDHLRRIRDAARGYPSNSSASSSQWNSAPNPYPSPYSNHTPASSASPQYHASPTPRLPPPASLAMPGGGYSSNRPTFKNSPFYTILKPLTPPTDLRPREQTRDTAKLKVELDDTLAAKFQNDPNCRAMVFCSADSYDSAWKPVDIAFPTHAELKVNQEDVKANLKGLKNKPGSTRPADITSFMRKRAQFPNHVELIYALTNKDKIQKYTLQIHLVQKRPIQSLVDELKRGKYLSRDRVIREMLSRANDDDIVATSSNMSLKDPVQMTRIDTPCRSMACKHNECFDAAVYLALQEQAPTWTCPICNRPAPWESLVFDLFVQHILDNTDSETEQVTVEPDGQWHKVQNEEENDNKNPFGKHDDSDDDDDLVEITDLEAPRTIAAIRTRLSLDPVRTPSVNGSGFPPPPRPPSSASLAQSLNHSMAQPTTQSRKRPREDVIDLTLSDDDDEPPVSRIKRPSVSSQVSADTSSRPIGAGYPPDPVRFSVPSLPTLPPPRRTDSPGNYYDFDSFNPRF